VTQLEHLSLVAELADGTTRSTSVSTSGPHRLGGLVIDLDLGDSGWGWAIVNEGPDAVEVVSVGLEWDAGGAGREPRMFRNGYQSWSPASVALLDVDHDPSTVPGAPSLVRGMHHADPRVAPARRLRSELVTVLDRDVDDTDAALTLVGFRGGADHDGTIWVSLDDRRRVIVTASAFLGGARLRAGERRALHHVEIATGPRGEASTLLEQWAARTGQAGGARTAAPYQVGWCSWYHYFHDVTEVAFRHNLERAGDWPFEVFQLDDGYQAAIGDWLRTNERFPSELAALAGSVRSAGMTPGIWLAPFLAAADSSLVRAHPDWIATHPSGRPLVGMVNPGWGGAVLTLDTTRPEVLDHLERTAAALVEAGFPYLKLDFTYAPSLPGLFADPTRTPAERVRAGMDAIRRGAGDDAFLLGCGLPLGAGIGVVDGMRIGADVAPWWEVQPDQWNPPGYAEVEPATRNAWVNTLTRSFMHRRLWLNDPDCVMLRTSDTALSPQAARAWALAVGMSGGMALVSDDLALLGTDARSLLDEVVALGRASDTRAVDGVAARCDDLMQRRLPGHLRSGDVVLVGDGEGSARIEATPGGYGLA
jgi:alpha-galactosidase